jgi:hypothetical protein
MKQARIRVNTAKGTNLIMLIMIHGWKVYMIMLFTSVGI